MHRSWPKVAALVAAALLVFAAGARRAPDSPFAGNWKLVDVSNANEATLVLFQVAEKDGKPQAKVLAAPLLSEDASAVSIDKFKIDDRVMQFEVKSPRGTLFVRAFVTRNKSVLGSITEEDKVKIAQFNKTDDTELSADDAKSETAEGQALAEAHGKKTADEERDALKELAAKNPGTPVAFVASQALLAIAVKQEAKEDELRAAAEQVVKSGAVFGVDVEKYAAGIACQTLCRADKTAPLAVEYGRRAEKALTGGDPPGPSYVILDALATALRRNGKDTEAAELASRVDKLEGALNAEIEKTAVPFKQAEYKGRKGNSQRVAVVELLTGAYCPPCVAADVAFDAALKTYQPKDVIFLQYHVHIPRPDRLTNPDTDKRMQYYRGAGVPYSLLNGEPTKALGGRKENGERSYNTLREQIDDALETPAKASLKLVAERKGDKVAINAEVADAKNLRGNVYLRFVVVEEVARYAGGNGQRLHHHVVRAMPGGADGVPVKDGRHGTTVDLAELRKTLDDYMDKFQISNEGPFLDDEHPLRLKHLKVVALVQDDDSHEILQAAQVDVPEAK
jgi:hypothetical protein